MSETQLKMERSDLRRMNQLFEEIANRHIESKFAETAVRKLPAATFFESAYSNRFVLKLTVSNVTTFVAG